MLFVAHPARAAGATTPCAVWCTAWPVSPILPPPLNLVVSYRHSQLSAPLTFLRQLLSAFRRPWTYALRHQIPMGAGSDACIAAQNRKEEHYLPMLKELKDEGYDYKPLVWTCWGRPSLQAQGAIRTLAAVAARRRGLADARPLERRAQALIGAQIWRRAAAMALACLRRTDATDAVSLLPSGCGTEMEEAAGDACSSLRTRAVPGPAARVWRVHATAAVVVQGSAATAAAGAAAREAAEGSC